MKMLLIRNTLLTAGASLGIAVIGFVMVPFLISRLGTVQFGLVGIAMIFLAGTLGFMELGLQTSITKFTAEYRQRDEMESIAQTVGTACAIFLGMGTLAAAVGWWAADPLTTRVLNIPAEHHTTFSSLLRLIFVSYLFQLPSLVFLGVIEGFQRFGTARGIHLAGSVAIAAGSVAALLAGFGFASVILITVLVNLLQFLAYLWATHLLIPGGGLRRIRFSVVRLREIGRMSRYVFLGKLSGLVFKESDRFLIGILMGPSAFAAYEVLFRLPRFLKTLIGFTSGAVLPAASELYTANSQERLQSLYLRGIRFTLYFSLPVIAVSAVLAEAFLRVWVGPQFTWLAGLLQLLLVWSLVSVLSGFGGLFLVGTNTSLREATLYSYAITALKLLILLLLLRPLGLTAIVLGSVVSTLIVLPGLIRLYHRALSLSLAEMAHAVLPLIWPLAVPLGIAYLTPAEATDSLMGFAFRAGVFCLTYWVLAYIVSLGERDRDLLKELARAATRYFRPPVSA